MTDSHAQSVRHLARGGSVNLLGAIVAAVFGFALTWVVARGASLSDAGVFFATTSLFLILVAVAEAGGDASLPRFVPLLRAQGRGPEVRSVVRLATLLTLGLGAVLGVVLLVAHGPLNHLLGLEETGRLDVWVLATMAVALPLTALANVLLAATRGYFTIRPTVLIDKIGRTLTQFGLVSGAVLLGSLGLMIDAWILPMALAAIPAAWLLHRQVTAPDPSSVQEAAAEDEDGAPPEERAGESLSAAYVRYTWPRAISRLLAMVLQRADVVVVAALLSPSEAAIYAVATRLIVLGQAAAQSIQQVLAPRIAHLIEEDDMAAAMEVTRVAGAWTILLCWPLYLLCISAGPLLLTVLGGPEYVPGWPLLCVLAVAMLAASATGPKDTVLLMAGRSGLSLGNMIAAVVTDLVLLFVLTPRWGILGAGVAWACALVLRSALGVWFLRRLAGGTAFGRPSLVAAATTVVAFLMVPWVLGLRDQGVTTTAAAILLLCAGLMAALAWVFREPLSLTAFRSLLRR